MGGNQLALVLLPDSTSAILAAQTRRQALISLVQRRSFPELKPGERHRLGSHSSRGASGGRQERGPGLRTEPAEKAGGRVQPAQGPAVCVETSSDDWPTGRSLSLALTAETLAKWLLLLLLLETSTATLNGSSAAERVHSAAPQSRICVSPWQQRSAGLQAADADVESGSWKPLVPYTATDIILDLLWSRMLSWFPWRPAEKLLLVLLQRWFRMVVQVGAVSHSSWRNV